MSVRMSIFRKKHDLEQVEFREHWRDVHAPIAVTIPALQRYEQNYILERRLVGEPKLALPVDGVCKLEFVNETAMQSVMSPAIRQALAEDEAKFIEGLCTFVVEPSDVVVNRGGTPTKCVLLVSRPQSVSADVFQHRWSGEFARWLSAQPGVAAYTQNFVTARTTNREPATYEECPIDCVDELWLNKPANSQTANDLLRSIEKEVAQHAEALHLFVVEVNIPGYPHLAPREERKEGATGP